MKKSMTMLAVMAVLGVNTVLGANTFTDVPMEGTDSKAGKISVGGDVRVRFDTAREHGIYINAPLEPTKIKVNGKEVALSKGIHELHLSEDANQDSGMLKMVDLAFLATVKGIDDYDLIAKPFKHSEASTALVKGIDVPEMPDFYEYDVPKIVWYYKNLHNAPSKYERDLYEDHAKRLNSIASLYTHTPDGMGLTFTMPDGVTAYEWSKINYDQWVKAKEEFLAKYPKAKDDFHFQTFDSNLRGHYYDYRESTKLPEYIYNLSKQYGLHGRKQSSTSYRVRVHATADVGEHTKFGIRLAQEGGSGGDVQKRTRLDRLWLSQRFGSSQVVLGRVGAMIGDGLVFEGDFDGIVGATQLGGANVTAGYGYPIELASNVKDLGQTIWYGQLQVPVTKHISSKVYMAILNSNATSNDRLMKAYMGNHLGYYHRIYGVSLMGDHGRFGWNGEYAKRTAGEDNAITLPVLRDGKGRNAWMVGARYTYGKATVGVQYFHLGQNSPILVSSVYDARYTKNWKGLVTTLNYNFNDNLRGKVGYAFKGSAVEIFNGAVAPAEKYFAQVEYKF